MTSKIPKIWFQPCYGCNLNLIRRNLLSREDASLIVERHDGLYPSSYVDRSLNDILSYYKITLDEFNAVCDDYTNYDLFQQNTSGRLILRDDGSPKLDSSFSSLHP